MRNKRAEVPVLLFFHKDETTTQQQQSMHYSYIKAESQQLPAIRMANTGVMSIWGLPICGPRPQIYIEMGTPIPISMVDMGTPAYMNHAIHSVCRNHSA